MTLNLCCQTIPLTAYMNKWVNGSIDRAQDVTDDATWSCDNPAVTITDGVVSSTTAGTFTIYAECDDETGDSHSASVNVTFTADTNYITLTADPTSTTLDNAIQATVKWNGVTDVTTSSTIKAYTSESGTTVASGVSITTAGVVTATSEGTYYLEATYTTGGKTYTSARTAVTFTDPNYILLSLDPTTIVVSTGRTVPTVTWHGDGSTLDNSSLSFKAYTTESGNVERSINTYAGKSTIGADATGDYYVEASYTTGGKTYKSNRVKLTVTEAGADVYTITISPNPGSVQVGSTRQFTYTMTKNGRAFTPATTDITWAVGNTALATISSSGLVTGVAAGTTTVTVKYKDTVATDTADLTVTAAPSSPLVIGWEDSAPTYVANQGKLTVTGLTSGESVTKFEATVGDDKVRLTKSGNSCYVGHLGAGSYTVQATTSNGRTISQTGTVTAQTLTLGATTLYANPDGTEAHADSDGLTGNTLTVSYTAGSTVFSTTTESIAVGSYLNKSLYDELLDPQYSSTNSLVHAGSDGVWATDIYSYSASRLSLVTVAPKVSSTGVSSTTCNVYGVDPFSLWHAGYDSGNPGYYGDEDDYGLISQYIEHSYYRKTPSYPEIRSTKSCCGIEVFRNGSVLGSSSPLRSAYTVTYKPTYGEMYRYDVEWWLTDSALSEHIAGLIEFKGYVENGHTHNRIYQNGHQFGIFVHGAIGAKAIMTDKWAAENYYNSIRVILQIADNVDGTPFARSTSGSTTNYSVGSDYEYSDVLDHNLGSCPYWINTSQTTSNVDNTSLTTSDYILMILPAKLISAGPPAQYERDGENHFVPTDAEALMMTDGPKLKWGTVMNGNLVKRVGDVIYLRNDETEPTITVDDKEDCGYYVLHLLSDIQNKGYKNGTIKGWIND